MPKIKLTKSAIDALKPASRDEVYWDAALPGFGVKVTPKGRKVFIALYRVRGGKSQAAQVHDWSIRQTYPPSCAGYGSARICRTL